MRVFVSSTVYDILDIRAALDALLRELNLIPVLSDNKLSDFKLSFDANSIETCLLNVDTSDAVIVILDQRYGPKLGDFGFDNVSATHLEYRRAKKKKKPIYFYVRDRLEADYTLNKQNKGKQLDLSWIKEKEIGLFEFLEEHRKLIADGRDTNWFSLFTSSIDLKESVRRHLEPATKPMVLMQAIEQNRFPLFTKDTDASSISRHSRPAIKLMLTLKNVGLAPAFDFTSQWNLGDGDTQKQETIAVVAPNQEVPFTLLPTFGDDPTFAAKLMVRYQTSLGIEVREEYLAGCQIQADGHSIVSGTNLRQRTYHYSKRPDVVIEK